MTKSDYYYDLPQELIAQDPLEDRSASRLMVLDRKSGSVTHKHFYELGSYLKEGDCLVFNDTRVIPARLLGLKKDTGAAVEILLLKRNADDVWESLVKPGKKLRTGAEVVFGVSAEEADKAPLRAVIKEVLPDGNRLVQFHYQGIWEEVLDALGEMPLPPYITHKLPRENRERYQTVYAKHEGSAAAPTAGLHFTKELMASLKEQGIRSAFVTLHVGLGTFRPVKEENILDHHMHTESCRIDEETARTINETRAQGGRIICVGTTSVRTLESFADANGIVHTGEKETDIFIYPGYQFKAVDGLVTNFHLPESTLLMLVSAFAGREQVLAAYAEAVKERYRFFSFGDAMLLI
ncbi:MAG: tRNA preQ1(34) S-adenosylmethionine ribosyltransferase-isomerase QueA [Lachnospiraceae bacterium]|nr:tRNA preQ1(34) S-adenosylmethionine ribosyltransferase-isomerase QueA [Lachnospiraceae bacterium]